MFDQPSNIANVTVGYDIGGFSARLSYLFQAEVLRGLATNAEADQFTESYYRWDLALKQKLGRGVEIYANLNNLNNRADRNFQSSIGQYPTFIEYYGFTMDAGVRYSF
jgi:outer membrane receptor protein involved in Fe transport